ncbi:MAG: hypothetical protein M1840_009020 [Geoglossum simile]|nr:MAG: hypothetical protein M1840_009020 [Geoglossum simile]
MSHEDPRASRLARYFHDVLFGKRSLSTSKDGERFIEAVCSQPDRPACLQKLVVHAPGLSSVQGCLWFDTSPTFLNGPSTSLLKYLQDPRLRGICGGYFFQQVILRIVDPPIFWDPFVRAYKCDDLEKQAQQAFGWLLLELISLSDMKHVAYIGIAQDPTIQQRLLSSTEFEVRTIGERIKHVVATLTSPVTPEGEWGPGGRHDNDKEDFRLISIHPTADELTSSQPAFLRVLQAVENHEPKDARPAVHLDNQFRLLREDMLGEIREELHIALGRKKGRHRGIVIDELVPIGVDFGPPGNSRHTPWGLKLESKTDFNKLFKTKVDPKMRKSHLTANPNTFKHQSLACLIVDGDVVAFPTIIRNEDLLIKTPPIVVVQLTGDTSTHKALLRLKSAKTAKLVQIDTAVFSYEPVLRRLQEIKELSLANELLLWDPSRPTTKPPSIPTHIVASLEGDPQKDLQQLLNTPKPIMLDASQGASLLMSLTQNVSLIQGPPGTGKSFIGALTAKALHDHTSQIILVVCYTNHALDQFLEDLLDIGIPQQSMVRLGGKSTARTKTLGLRGQPSGFRMNRDNWAMIEKLKSEASRLAGRLSNEFKNYLTAAVRDQDLMEHLEFDDSDFYDAFAIPESSDGATLVGRGGKAVNKFYLLNRWKLGIGPGIVAKSSHSIWEMSPQARNTTLERWRAEILKEKTSQVCKVAEEYNKCISRIDSIFNQKDAHVLSSKRIIACTTTGAAKYVKEIQSASPGVLLVEEAGEILESHILTALGSETKQLILIGDHQQLRPKYANYSISVEKGEGFDFNRSLFERLVLKGFPHQTLNAQHRMRPEISSLVRQLTYPALADAPSTKGRPDLRGFQGNVIFVNHNHPEDDNALLNQNDPRGSSKQNTFEAKMILNCVRYLSQNGYGSEKIVVLTPYLAQLHLLRNTLRKENDPVLNDLDSHELIRAGLIPAAAAQITKRPLRISSIDNYQGEECEIVLVSMTRSNTSRDIGFMSYPERLNVLLSRARNSIIMIGNTETFLNARNGKEIWTKFFNLLKLGGQIHDGFPVRCERHKDRMSILRRPDDFAETCPDGGCMEPCGTILSCGVHSCPQRCHQLSNHSKTPCHQVMESKCSEGHIQRWKCHENSPASCRKCERDTREKERKIQEAFRLQQEEDLRQREHTKAMALLDDMINLERQKIKNAQSQRERESVIQQRKKDLEDAAAMTSRMLSQPPPARGPPETTPRAVDPLNVPQPQQPQQPQQHSSAPPVKAPESHGPATLPKSPSEKEWQRQKSVDNASNDAIDSIMDMTGLEEVKSQVLRIKAQIDTSLRQNTDLKDQRFHAVLLGNPGTGKTTIARFYAKFLASVGVLPGSEFIETTGSRLANDGVPGAKKLIEQIHNAGGGAIFVDEAYQLTEKQNYSGGQVLDFLLAEMENNVGKIAFILAGYNKQMEKFFEHNPGLTSRVPYRLQFADYTDSELLRMLRKLIDKKFQGRMKIEDGPDGLFLHIVVSRIGRGRDREGFGNARTLQNTFSKILERQSARLSRERAAGLMPDDFCLTQEDLIGPDPSKVIVDCGAWKKLQEQVGLETVKDSIRILIDRISTNYERELRRKKPVEVSLNRVFLGSPGTGKTTVGKLYGQILADLGLLSNGEVVVKNPADFVGSVLGESESNTKAILATTVGKVLIIDEAYMLYSGGGGAGNQSDTYKTAVIDTIVAEVQSVPGEDRCVLLLGYEDQIREMFQNVNPGLSRRFAIDNAFHFQDFTGTQLRQILDLKLKNQELEATDKAKDVAMDVLGRACRRPNFGNAGEVENLLGMAKSRQQSRLFSKPASERSADVIFEPEDFDPNFNRGENATLNCRKLFEDVVGCDEIVRKLEGYQQTAQNMKARGVDPNGHIPTNFVFKGPPGTGKTTTARKMGQIFYDMGFLSSAEVVECSASDLVGQYVGHTGPKTQQQLEKGLGKVLFVDEAYRLGEGHFATEAINQLVDLLTKPKFMGKIVVILAGYDNDMDQLMAVNAGLSSRFPEEVIFRNMSPEHCLQLLVRDIEKQDIAVAALRDPGSALNSEMLGLLGDLSNLQNWGNARDVLTLAKTMINSTFRASTAPKDPLVLSPKEVLACTRAMLTDRTSRSNSVLLQSPKDSKDSQMDLTQTLNPLSPTQTATRTGQATLQNPTTRPKNEEEPRPEPSPRDPNVPDPIWNQLQADRAAYELAQEVATQEIQQQKDLDEAFAAQAKALALAEAKAAADAADAKLRRKLEEEKIRELLARKARDRARAAAEKAEQRRREETRTQTKLRQMGVCCMGYQWIKQVGGYRCAGGSHFVTDGQLGI